MWRSNTAGRKTIRSIAGVGGRSRSPQGGGDRRDRRRQLVLAAKAATTTIPIVFTTGGDPVQDGLRRQPQPAGRQHHRAQLFRCLGSRQAAGTATRARSQCRPTSPCWSNPKLPDSAQYARETRRRRRARLGGNCLSFNASAPSEIDTAFATLRQRRAGALLVGGDPSLPAGASRLSRWRRVTPIPAMYSIREFCEGGLMSYGTSIVRRVSPSRHLRRPDSQGRKARRPAGRSGDQVRVRDQPQDREGARPRPCRRRCSPAPTR